ERTATTSPATIATIRAEIFWRAVALLRILYIACNSDVVLRLVGQMSNGPAMLLTTPRNAAVAMSAIHTMRTIGAAVSTQLSKGILGSLSASRTAGFAIASI